MLEFKRCSTSVLSAAAHLQSNWQHISKWVGVVLAALAGHEIIGVKGRI
jgi:hypothetical protein